MFCNKCGSEMSDQAKFCPKCGAAVSKAENGAPDDAAPVELPVRQAAQMPAQTSTAVAAKPKRKALFVVIPIVVVLIAAAIFLVPGLFASPKDPVEDDSPTRGKTEDVTPAPKEKEDAASTRKADAELLALIDRTEARIEEGDSIILEMIDSDSTENTDTETYLEIREYWAQILNDTLADLREFRKEADAISGLDGKMMSARDEYFDMLCAAKAAHAASYQFLSDFLNFYFNDLIYRPDPSYYGNQEEYVQAFNTWYEECTSVYSSISYPTCVESEWKQVAEMMDYSGSIANKLLQSVRYDDPLRYYSTEYMNIRYETVQQNLVDKLLNCVTDEGIYADYQQSIASSLAEEMHAYAEMDQKSREAFEFENNRRGEVALDYETVDTIYPSLYNTYDAFVIIKTGCISGTKGIMIEAEIEGFTQKYSQSFDLDSSYRAIYIKPPAVTGELNLSSAKDAQLKVTVTGKDGTLIDAKTFPVTIKSRNDVEWYSEEYGISTQDNILCFLTPEASAINDLKRQAIEQISAITDGQIESFPGYQHITPVEYATTYLHAAGLMSALCEIGVRYDNDGFSLSGSNQSVKFPEEVIAGRSGLCIETALVVASALQKAGMHAFLVFPPGHAQVAVEIWNSGDWQGAYLLIETTKLEPETNNIEMFAYNFEQMLDGYAPDEDTPVTYLDNEEWSAYLENRVQYVIDCDDSQLLGLTAFAN